MIVCEVARFGVGLEQSLEGMVDDRWSTGSES